MREDASPVLAEPTSPPPDPPTPQEVFDRIVAAIRMVQEQAPFTTPLDIIRARMLFPGEIPEASFQAACAAAPFVHPRLAAIAVQQAPTSAPEAIAAQQRALGTAHNLLKELENKLRTQGRTIEGKAEASTKRPAKSAPSAPNGHANGKVH
jgi:hypothetical protein